MRIIYSFHSISPVDITPRCDSRSHTASHTSHSHILSVNHNHVVSSQGVGETRGGLVSTLFSSVRHYADVVGWRDGALFPGNGLCKQAPFLGGVQEIGAVTMEAGIRIQRGEGGIK